MTTTKTDKNKSGRCRTSQILPITLQGTQKTQKRVAAYL